MKAELNSRLLIIGTLLLGVVAVGWHYATSVNEPVYQGRPLKAWLSDLGHGDDRAGDGARTALREIFHPTPTRWRQTVGDWFVVRLHFGSRFESEYRKQEERFVRTMISLLSDQDSGVRSGAAFALENCPEAAPHIAPALAARISDSDQRTRLWAARSLGHMLSEPRVVIPALIRALNDEDENVRGYACLSLENFGTNAVEAVPALRKLIEQFGRSEWAAIQALKVISPEATSPSRAKAKARAFDGPLTIGVPGS